MCFAVKFTGKNQEKKTVYVGQEAQVPVINSSGAVQLVRWGRDKKEEGKAFAHHCARMESIEAGKWSWLQPKAVNMQIEEFADWGTDGQVHWHVVPDGHSIRGALIQDGETLRAYVVTEPVIAEMAKYSKGGRWPRVVAHST